MQEARIEMTEDYDMFRYMKGNRVLDMAHVQKLKASMKLNDLFIPILVNEKMEVVDGQHRLEARRQLGYIVPYIIGKDYVLEDVQAMNCSQKAWSIGDYTDSYIARGNDNYSIFKWFRAKYGLSHLTSLSLLTGSDPQGRHLTQLFNSGSMVVTHLEEAKQFAEFIHACGEYFPHFKERSFTMALLALRKKEQFDQRTFLRKLRANPTVMRKSSTTNQYIEEIEAVYNYRSSNKVNLRF